MTFANRFVLVVAAAGLAAPHAVLAQSAPAGWQTVTNVMGKCHLAVPADWVVEKGGPGAAVKPGTSWSARLNFTAPRATFAELRDRTQRTWKIRPAFTVVAESATRAVYRYKTAGRYQWSIIVAGTPACQMTLSTPTADDPLAMKVAGTLSPGK